MKVETTKMKFIIWPSSVVISFRIEGEPDAVDIIDFNVMVAIVTTECEITTMGILASLK